MTEPLRTPARLRRRTDAPRYSNRPLRPTHTRRRRKLLPLALAAPLALALAAGPALPVRLNLTPSLPRGLYLSTGEPATGEPPAPGRLALVCLPAPAVRLGLARSYLWPGTCPGGAAPVLKPIAATAGDRVAVTPAGVTVGGRLLPASAPRSADNAGRPLAPHSRANAPLAPGQLWLHAPRADSWDSRYYGPVPLAAVLATLRPLLVLPDRHAGPPTQPATQLPVRPPARPK